MIQIITDSASDITLEQAREMNIHIVPLTIMFEDGECPQEKDEDFEIFYERLVKAKKLPTTSQPSPERYLKLFETAKKQGDQVLVITLSSGLSGTIGAARVAKDLSEYDQIYILDSKQAIIAQRVVVEYAVKLRAEGCTIEEMIEKLEDLRERVTISGVLDTLTYLRKGGRVPASLAILGNAIGIKPVIVLEDTILKTLEKVRGRKAGKKALWKRLEAFDVDPEFPVYFGYSSDPKITEEFAAETIEKYHLEDTRISPVGGVIGTHVGTSCIALCFVRKK